MLGAAAIDQLRARMARALDLERALSVQPLAVAAVMTPALRAIQRDLGGEGDMRPNEDVVKASLIEFAQTGQVANFTRLKYVCHGLAVPIGPGQRRILDNSVLFEGLLGHVTRQQDAPRQFRRTYQGLLAGYLGVDQASLEVAAVKSNWTRLQAFLATKLDWVLQTSARPHQPMPTWLTILDQHRNLLGDKPCARYAEGLQRQDASELKQVCAGLGITTESWVWERSLMDYVRLVCAGADPTFQRGLPDLLDLANGHRDLALPGMLSQEVVAMAVRRYAACTDTPEHAGLRDGCIARFGNPWLRRTAWDAQVRSEPARTMVERWIKRRLIRDFFELLAEDGSADLRRLNYWLKWEPYISDMWFILGTDAQANKSPAFLELRKRMAGRDRYLRDTNHRNNAFVMRLGPLIALEFGVTGNAARLFAAADFKADLEQKWFPVYALKQDLGATKLSHSGSWEWKFDEALKARLGSNLAAHASTESPAVTAGRSSRSVSAPDAAQVLDAARLRFFKTICTVNHLEWEDNLDKGGAFWVFLPDRSKKKTTALMLERHGFKDSPGKGFWIKGTS